jgi:hypothetical protein
MRKALVLSTAGLLCTFPFGQALNAQTVYTLPGAASLPAQGATYNLSSQSGNKSSLNFGSSTSFGTSASMNAAPGSRTSSSSLLAPKAGDLKFTIGGSDGVTSANISNLKSSGGIQSSAININGGTVNTNQSDAPGDFSSGDAKLSGVQGGLVLTIDPDRTAFRAETQTLHSTDPAKDFDGIGKQYGEGPQNSNASANAAVNSSTNVDINTSGFTSVFMQAF